MNNSIFNKRILSIIIITSFLMGVLFFSITYILNETENNIRQELITSVFDREQEQVKKISLHISSDLELISDKLALTAVSLQDGDFTSQQSLDSLEKLYLKLNSKISVGWVFVLDENGIVISSVSPVGPSISSTFTDLSYRDYYIDTKTTLNPYFTNGFIGINDVPLIISTFPILDSDGKFIGMLGSSLIINDFFEQYGNISDPDSELLIIIGNDKNFITHPNPQLVGKNFSSDEFVSKSNSKQLELIDTLLAENHSSGMYQDQNQEIISSGQAIIINEEPQYFVLITTPVDSIHQQTIEILQQAKSSTYIIILFLIFATIIVIVFFEKYKIKEQEQIDIKLISIGELSARLAHDIRNPLSVIKNSLSNLKISKNDPDALDKTIDRCDRAVDRIAHQIDGVLDFIRERPLTLEKTKMSSILSDAMDSLKIPKDIQLILPKNDVEINCDKNQLHIVINNIILNGIQAINGPGTILFSLLENDDNIILKIEDSGRGIDKRDLANVFDPMFTTKQHGTGLGLVSSKAIIKSHKGTISVKSPPTIFTITLPKVSD